MTQRLNQALANRIFTLLALIAIAPALLIVVDLPARAYTLNVLGSPVTLNFTTDTLLVTLVPVLAVAGVDWVLREHPSVRRGTIAYLFPFWMAPGIGALALSLLLSSIGNWALWLTALMVGVGTIGILIYAEYVTLDADFSSFANARLIVTGLTYVIAFALFTLIYAQRDRTVISATQIMLITFVLSLELLEPHRIGLRSATLGAAVVAFLIGQGTWAINYWNVSTWSAGVLLLAMFYVCVGLTQQHHQGQLTRGVLIEYCAVALIALVVVWLLAESR